MDGGHQTAVDCLVDKVGYLEHSGREGSLPGSRYSSFICLPVCCLWVIGYNEVKASREERSADLALVKASSSP